MRCLVIGIAALALSAAASAQVYVHGYTKKDGTYVAPHYRSNSDGNPYNNWSTKGNVNPYTGQPGTKDPYGNSNSSYGYSQKPSADPYSNSNSSYGYSNPYSSKNSNSSKTTCYFPPC